MNGGNFETKIFTWKSNIKWVVREPGIAGQLWGFSLEEDDSQGSTNAEDDRGDDLDGIRRWS